MFETIAINTGVFKFVLIPMFETVAKVREINTGVIKFVSFPCLTRSPR